MQACVNIGNLPSMSEKIQKVLARAGLGSRREVERMVAERKVSINGKIIEVGARVEEGDVIRVGGKIINSRLLEERPTRVLIYNKPEGEVCSRRDEKGRATVFDRLPVIKSGRWIGVGRLDINTTGLMLFTTNGELADRLMHPKYEVTREYMVRVFGDVTNEQLSLLKNGVELDDGMAKFSHIAPQGGQGKNTWYRVGLQEGRNREVKRLWESQGLKVSRLNRITYGPIEIPRGLKLGRYRDLEPFLIIKLLKSVGLQGKPFERK